MDEEATLHNYEVFGLCIRSTNEDDNVKEELIDFISLIKITGESIVTSIKQTLDMQKSALDM